MGVEVAQALKHGVVEGVGVGDAVVDPCGHGGASGAPTEGVGDVALDLTGAFVAMGQHALEPTGVQRLGARLERHHFLD